MEIFCVGLDVLPTAVGQLLAHTDAATIRPPVWLFEGEMGAGKTTLIKEICRQRGVEDTVNSPTFALVNEYLDGAGQPVYHFDFYRLDEAYEAETIGTAEYFDSGYLCLVEWPARVPTLWPDTYLRIFIEAMPDGTRRLLLTHVHEDTHDNATDRL
ncbi:MAG: tRNA (adenosine(37)-N6)-threonylcarbamoyltransferase complex ATPase subunit type 1 TsaE [Catalinimonas sp.]